MAEELSPIKTVMGQVALWKNNPAGVRRVVLDHISNITSGKIDVVDPTSPFSCLLESSCMLASSFMTEHEALLRKQYPSLAQTAEELYLHMSDKDYIDRFALPAKTKFNLLIKLGELKQKLVLDPSTGIKKVTIPKDSEFIIADTVFTLQYPIDIKMLTHGGFQVTYDTTEASPLQELTTNMVEWDIITYSNMQQEMMHIEFDVYQLSINSYQADLPVSTGYKKLLAYTDQYHYCRVYNKSSSTGNEWQEIKTTHSDQVYDPLTPTASLKVLPSQLSVFIPQIYFTTGAMSGGIRIDIYQTKGPINLLLQNYKADAFSANFKLIDKDRITEEIAAFQSIESVFAYANKTVIGGRDALSFSQLRQRVIQNSIGYRNIPITNVQIESALANSGYDIVKNVDVVTNRQYLATKALPEPFDQNLITKANASVATLIASVDQLKTHTLVKNNGDRITLTPSLLYESINSVVSVVSDARMTQLRALPKEDLAKEVTQNQYLFTPFHYVLDASKGSFDFRSYYMDEPSCSAARFISQNDTTGLAVNTDGFRLVRVANGYRLYVEVKSNKAYKDVPDAFIHAQLAFKPKGSGSVAYINATIAGLNDASERIFAFDIDTDFDIDEKHLLYITNALLSTPGSHKLPVELSSTFNIYYATSITLGHNWHSRGEDLELGRFTLPARIAYITKESITLTFGQYLKHLWTSYRSIPSASSYRTYTTDIPATYEEDVYEIDPATGSAFKVDHNGNLVYKKLHSKGDAVLDSKGKPVLKHKAGEIMLDANKLPIPIASSTVLRQLDIAFIEGAYYFTDDAAAISYRQAAISTMLSYITDDLPRIATSLLEQTNIYYYPKATLGSIKVMTDDSTITTMQAAQSFSIKLYVAEDVFINDELQKQLARTTIKTIDSHLRLTTVSVSALSSELRAIYKDDVIAFSLTAFGSSRDTTVVSILTHSDRFSVRKKLVLQADNSLTISEDVTVEFILHSL